MIRALTLLNEQGDVTLMWEEAQDAMMLAVIEKKMTEGIVFFIIEPRLGGLVAPIATQILAGADAIKHRALRVSDPDFAKLVGIEGIMTIKTPDAPVKTVRKAKTAKEVVKAESVAVRPARGG